jgi:hypothetical protein
MIYFNPVLYHPRVSTEKQTEGLMCIEMLTAAKYNVTIKVRDSKDLSHHLQFCRKS